MILVIYYKNLKEEFYNQQEIIYLDLKITIKEKIIINKSQYSLYNRIIKYQDYLIYISINKTKKFDYYQKIDYLSIASGKNMTIRVNNLKEKIEIENYFLKTNSEFCFVNKLKVKNTIIKNYDLIEILDLKLMICPEFIVINRKLENLNHFKVSNFKIKTKETITIKKKYRYQINKPELDIKLKELKLEKNSIDDTFRNEIPQIMMTLASLFIGIALYFNYRNYGNNIMIIYLVFPITMLISTLIIHPLNRSHKKKHIIARNNLAIEKYNKYLDEIEAEVKSKLKIYQKYLNNRYLSVNELASLKKLYFKEKYHNDYLFLAIGKGRVKTNFSLKLNDLDQVISSKISNIQDSAKYLRDSFFELNILEYNNISIINKGNYFNYLFLQLLIYYPPSVFILIIVCSKDFLEKNKYIKRIPHLKTDDSRYIACCIEDVKEIDLEIENIKKEKIIIVYDQSLMKFKSKECHYLINCQEDNIYEKSDLIINANDSTILIDNERSIFNYEDFNFKMNEVIDKINNYQLEISKNNKNKNNIYEMMEISKIEDYQRDTFHHHLQAPLASKYNGEKLTLDIAYNSQGPHGILAGTTGSGKSELMVSFLLMLAIKYSCKNLNFVIIDFKGEGIMSNLRYKNKTLPHVINSLSNIDEAKIDKALLSFKIEANKRMTLFKKMSEITNEGSMDLALYQKLYQKEFSIPYLAHILIVIDEFAELKSYKPDFIDEIISLARIGRSLGIHLLLATQKVTGVINEEILANISYRICMKVNDKAESRTLIESDRAYNLNKAGELILYHHGIIEEGRGVLANVTADLKEISQAVYICDYRLHQLKKGVKHHESSIKQSSEIVSYLCNHEVNHNSSLWKENLTSLSYSKLKSKYQLKDTLIIGEYDDIERGIQNPLILNIDKNHLLISLNYQLKNKFINNIVNISTYLTIKCFILDPLFSNEFKQADFITKNYDDVERLFYYLKNKQDNDKIFVIISNTSYFTEHFSQYKELLCDLMQNGFSKKISFLLIASSYQSVYYKFINLIEVKMTIDNYTKSDLLSIFDAYYPYNYLEGLIYMDKFYNFKLLESVQINKKYKTNNKILAIQYDLTFCKNNKKYLVGFSLVNYKEKWLNFSETCLMTSFDQNLLELYKNKYDHNNIDYKHATNLVSSDLSYDTVIFFKPGLKNQYIFDSRFELVNDDEALVIKGNKYERIKYVK